ncbi:nucleotide-binding universal stress UspA family protein [Streptomyces sp. 846.5]|nr:universal stress protein [Streptomyces sp. 846.5]TDT97950.1 nucleotide-binding universal stress UspA family protein [Streptomyces sp. 846.5]
MAGNVRVIVGVSGSLGSLAALHRAVEEARRLDAVLVPVLAWHPVGGEFAYRSHPCPPLLAVWEQAARKRLDTAFEQCFGGYPADLRIHPMVVRDEEPGRALVQIADQAADVLIVGAGRRGRLACLFHGSVSRRCLAYARCAVTAAPPSELLAALEAAARDGGPMSLPRRWTDAAHAA